MFLSSLYITHSITQTDQATLTYAAASILLVECNTMYNKVANTNLIRTFETTLSGSFDFVFVGVVLVCLLLSFFCLSFFFPSVVVVFIPKHAH